jgi:hypothetical protein
MGDFMKIHPTEVEGFDGTNEELAGKVFAMRYDKVAEFLFYGMVELNRQYEGDKKIGRLKLARLLLLALYKVGELVSVMMKIFFFCKPFMKEELELEANKKGGQYEKHEGFGKK